MSTNTILRIKQVRSASRCKSRHRLTLEALGLRRTGRTVEKKDTPQIRGMINQVKYLVTVEEV